MKNSLTREIVRSQDTALDPDTCEAVVGALIQRVNRHYVFPRIAQKIEERLKKDLSEGKYSHAINAESFVLALNKTLQDCANDKHLLVRYSETAVPEALAPDAPSPEERWTELARMQKCNFGVECIERLPSNIGYIDLHGFHTIEHAKSAITAAMTLVAYTDSLIIDLRKNDGGDPETVAFISSYLFNDRVHLNDMYWREGDRLEEFWTHKDVPGNRYGETKDLFVLIGKDTFSAAEEFAYNLQNLKRATLVGEKTRGGAHPCDMFKLHTHFKSYIPIGRAINPVSRTNWEGTGVYPDILVPEEKALEHAQLAALGKLAIKETAK